MEPRKQKRVEEEKRAPMLPPRLDPDQLLGKPGPPRRGHENYVRYLHQAIPPMLLDMARDTSGARALVLACLVDPNPAGRDLQTRVLAEQAEEGVLLETLRLWPIVQDLGPGFRLPLVELTLPALRRMSPNQYVVFKEYVGALAVADKAYDFLEYALYRIMAHQLDPVFSGDCPRKREDFYLPQVFDEAKLLLSVLVWAVHTTWEAATEAMGNVAKRLRCPPDRLPLLPPDACALGAVDQALDRLCLLVKNHKLTLLGGSIAAIARDDAITIAEAELLRAVAATLEFPLPTLMPGQLPQVSGD